MIYYKSSHSPAILNIFSKRFSLHPPPKNLIHPHLNGRSRQLPVDQIQRLYPALSGHTSRPEAIRPRERTVVAGGAHRRVHLEGELVEALAGPGRVRAWPVAWVADGARRRCCCW